ncbi:hypothetical protein C2S52_016828 [Perilla frutescens var. hirtella]|uniref:Transmembrane protein n=1 Tax=Perilla frutescens var. hirtella TaxID=608512 RepID=A0AAD4PF87_PERFH|nr:hypothetical protein C2S52_016828 [Perilla frutescens var. hirtella]KAH6810659.1 hypothetical protein C2S51_024421 [Perilla frutescens var. frutescens]KAH6814395.1 hypothetical protein C2S51_023413 [Perilla frutescens var. frutescens]KAH6837056.1 hypothetical protein C2S53_015038 [Perilla frutescens var. hirtella]
MARYYNSPYHEYLQHFSLPLHFLFFITTILIFLIFNWYINYEYIFIDFMDQIKLSFMVFPVLLLLLVHWLAEDRDHFPFTMDLPEKDSLHRIGGSPLGVAILLVLLMFMIYHHSSLQERWFPLFARR